MNLGFYSYFAAACGFGLLTLLLLPSWRSSLQGRLLTIVAITSAIWAGLAMSFGDNVSYQVFEILRYLAWYVFLLRLLEPAAADSSEYRNFLRRALPLCTGFAVLLLAGELYTVYVLTPLQAVHMLAPFLTGHVFLAIIGLAIIEQLFRNTSINHRWAIKYLFIGAGGIFAFDFYLYADALLFRGVDRELWEVRGLVNLVVVPMLAIAAARNKDWSLNIFVSRDIVLHTTTILGGGLYLLVVAGAGYYLRDFGGSWGRIAQVLFFSLAVVLLLTVLFSSQMRTRLRVFLGKHFYKNKYDYRREWLQLTRELNNRVEGEDDFVKATRVMAQIVDARAGLLWLIRDHDRYENVAAWQMEPVAASEGSEAPLIRFIENKAYVINLMEQDSHPEEYEGLDLPAWLDAVSRGWLIVPLFGLGSLLGFIVLANPLVVRPLNWEDRDLLKTAAMQVASHLTVLMASEALAEARQFEAFNRIASFMVHDLKNIAAELELVAHNAEKHKTNPEFIDDAFATFADTSSSIKRLLEQLRNRLVQAEKKVTVDLAILADTVISKQAGLLPVPQLEQRVKSCRVIAEKDRLENVLIHLVDNAREATGRYGSISIRLSVEAGDVSMCVVEIADDGHGMDADFIQNRLFKPFDTTKGNAGMGIGMYESREFIRQLQGEIKVRSEPGKGTVVALHLPACD
ncbi:MAG: XrtA/PEP-CTERM system histidine kinase PrsK [Pseudomonadota bacterium]